MNAYLAHDFWSVFVIWANIAGCSAAFVVACIVAVRVPRYRVGLFSVVLLCACYVVGYSALLFTDVEPGDWSSTMRLFGIVAWPLVWIWPQLRLLRKSIAVDEAVLREAHARGNG